MSVSLVSRPGQSGFIAACQSAWSVSLVSRVSSLHVSQPGQSAWSVGFHQLLTWVYTSTYLGVYSEQLRHVLLIVSLVLSRLDYDNATLSGLPDYHTGSRLPDYHTILVVAFCSLSMPRCLAFLTTIPYW